MSIVFISIKNSLWETPRHIYRSDTVLKTTKLINIVWVESGTGWDMQTKTREISLIFCQFCGI